MLEAERLARSYVGKMTSSAFLEDRMVQQAVILNLIVIGEAAVQIETEYPDFAAANQVVPWKRLRGMRNRMAHGYFDINMAIVWDTVQTYLPTLDEFLLNCSELSSNKLQPE